MIFNDFFINHCIFSSFVSLAIVIQVFTTRKSLKSIYLLGGCYASIVAVILMFFPVRYNEFFYDLRFAPLILSFVYFGYKAGWMTAIGIYIAHVYIGSDHWIVGVDMLGGTIFLFTLLKNYMKNLPSIKRAFLYLAIHFVVYYLILEVFSDLSANMYFHIEYFLFVFVGLLLGLLIIEAHNKLYRLTQSLSHLNQKLAESKQELQDTVREQQGAIFKFKKVNERFIHMMCDGQLYYRNEMDPKQVVGKDLQTMDPFVVPSHLVPQLLEYYQRAWEGQEVTFELPWPNDKTFIVILLRPVKREGKVIEVVGSAIDITERKKMEEELKVTKERLESFVNHNIDAIVIADLEGHILQANKAYEKIFGWSVQETLGQRLPCVPDLLMDEALEQIQKVISGESITRLETVRLRKDGSLFDVNLTISPILDSKRNVIAVSAIIRDISERKQVERELHRLHQQLQESEKKYRILFEQAVDGVYLVELDENRLPTRFLEVNPVGCERFGYSREGLLSMPFADIVSPNSTMLIRIVEKIREGKRSFTLQDEYVFKTGKKMDTEFSVRVFNLGEKEVFLAISRDITERLKTEELLRKAEKLAVVGQLAAAIAHEVNNPLTAMKGFMQLLKSPENENNQSYIDVVLSEMDRIEGITNEYIAVAKPQAVKVHPNDLHMLVEQVTLLLQSQAMMNNVQIRTKFESGIPLIPFERNQLKQVFINILKNAIEAMPLGGDVLIQVNKLDDHQVCIRFIDQGCGIPKERISHLGEPFYSIKEKGIGLGLMICYKNIEAHQGKIVIESELDKGTTVDIILPVNFLPH
ncbi:two-component system sporulation sensor kinase A [Bacillus fengqiuensis]|nr:two-component system sporulation sensor kinase A [Bacillus fengqiuensis]